MQSSIEAQIFQVHLGYLGLFCWCSHRAPTLGWVHPCPSLDMWKYVCKFLPSKDRGREPSGVGGMCWLTLSGSRWLSCRRFPSWELEKGQTSGVCWTLRCQSRRKKHTDLGERCSEGEIAPFALFSFWLAFNSILQAFIECHHIKDTVSFGK